MRTHEFVQSNECEAMTTPDRIAGSEHRMVCARCGAYFPADFDGVQSLDFWRKPLSGRYHRRWKSFMGRPQLGDCGPVELRAFSDQWCCIEVLLGHAV